MGGTHNLFVPGGHIFLKHRRWYKHFSHTWGDKHFTLEVAVVVMMLMLIKRWIEMDVSEANFLVSEANICMSEVKF